MKTKYFFCSKQKINYYDAIARLKKENGDLTFDFKIYFKQSFIFRSKKNHKMCTNLI